MHCHFYDNQHALQQLLDENDVVANNSMTTCNNTTMHLNSHLRVSIKITHWAMYPIVFVSMEDWPTNVVSFYMNLVNNQYIYRTMPYKFKCEESKSMHRYNVDIAKKFTWMQSFCSTYETNIWNFSEEWGQGNEHFNFIIELSSK